MQQLHYHYKNVKYIKYKLTQILKNSIKTPTIILKPIILWPKQTASLDRCESPGQ